MTKPTALAALSLACLAGRAVAQDWEECSQPESYASCFNQMASSISPQCSGSPTPENSAECLCERALLLYTCVDSWCEDTEYPSLLCAGSGPDGDGPGDDDDGASSDPANDGADKDDDGAARLSALSPLAFVAAIVAGFF